MAKFVVEFSPPEKIKLEPENVTDSVLNYCLVLAPFQKQTQVEFNNIKLKEMAIRFLTVTNPLDKPRQFILSPPSDGIYFDIYEFTLQPNSQRELSITWQPNEYGNIRKLIKIEQVDSNRKYDFVILGNCNGPPHKKFKGAATTSSKSANLKLDKKQLKYSPKKVPLNKTIAVSSKMDNIPAKVTEPDTSEIIRRQTYLVREKENVQVANKNVLGRDTILSSPERKIKRPNQRRQDYVFNDNFNFDNLNKSSSPQSDDSLEKSSNKLNINNSQFNDFCLTPLKSTENLLSPFSVKKCNHLDGSFDFVDGPSASTSISSSPFKLDDKSFVVPEYGKSKISINLCNRFNNTENELIKNNIPLGSNTISSEPFLLFSKIEQPSNLSQTCDQTAATVITWSGTKPRRPTFAIKNSPFNKYSSKTSMLSKNKSKQCSTSQRETRFCTLKLDKFDQHLKDLADPLLLYQNNGEDPFLNMSQSQYSESEWLKRQESDMIRWLNALLTPTDKLVEEEHSNDLEEAAMAWVEASKTSHKNKPMQFATQKDLFVAQIYRQSPQQWSALRKATTNLITSSGVTSVLSKLTTSIEKDLLTLRDDRQIHLDLSLKKKVIDLFKCYNPLWFRIGLEAIYGQIVKVKPGSSDLDGVGWFVRKNLLSNDYVKKKYTKTTVLQVNLPSYNTAMNKFILRKILMLIYFLDRAKEQQLIRHNPCLFKTNSPYKSSYDLLMGFCADMVTAHGDIVRRLRSMGFNLTHKQIHLDEVNYAVKSLNDLRDGTRITRVVEILFKGNPLSQKLRLPAISKLQKIHNVNLALTRISHHISIEGNINTRDIVNGHREKILSLFWQIIYKYLTPRYNNAASKIQNWWRNSSLKLVILKRIRIKQIAKRHSAATKIQARARGYLSRKHWPSLRTELVKNREMLHMASTTIKIYLKDKLKLLTEERKRFIILRRTVVLVQQIFRNKMAMVRERKKYLKTKRSALIIQKVFRGYILRKNFPRIKNDLIAEKTHRIAAVNTIKHAMRKNLPLTPDRLKLLKLKQTVIYVERLYIANRLMKLQRMYYTTLKITTVFIQRKFRANILMRKERENYLKAKHSALLIQKTFRGFIVRRHWTETRNHLISVKKLRFDAINKIKQAMRQNLPKTSDHLNFLKLKQTVLYVETLYIANKSMRMQMENYNTLRNTTLFIQQQFKANRAMKKERKNYLKTKQSALLIQKMFRGFIVRKYWTDTKNCLILEKNKRIDAINRVKRTLRQNLPKTQDRLNFLELKTAVLFIQQLWRANRLMKMQRKCYLETRYAAVFIQRKFRAQIAMRTGRKNYLKAKESALLIQKMYRGYSARKKWPSVKIHLLMDKTKRIQAINIIKHVLRKNLSPTLEKQYYNKLKHFTVAIQRRFRANIAMKKQREEFELLKHSAVILQRRFRAKQCMVATRKWFISLKTVTIQLQSAVRGCLVRKQWPEFRDRLQTNRRHLIQSVNTIKRALRKGLPPTEDRLRFLELKQSVTVVQQRYRANVHSKRQKAKYLQIIKTVFGLQCAARGYLFRQKLWPTYRSSLLENRLRLAQCSNVIKRCLRQRLPMTEDRTAFLKLKTAAIVIQRRYRAHRAMNYYRYKYVVLRILTIQLQSMARGHVFRQFKWPAMKTEFIARRQLMIKCANTIKRSLRKRLTYCERNQFLKLRSAAVVVQRKFRTRCQARKYQKLRNSVLAVQRRFRANVLARQQWTKYNFIRSTVIIFQAYCRGCLVRRQWPETKHALLTHRKHLTVACNTIKKFIRLCLPTRPERLEYLKLRRAVLVVQTRYRALVLARLVQTKYLRLRQSTIVLQRHYRARRATLAAIVLQAHIRGYLARKQWPLLKNRLMTDRELAINALREKNNAASKIQAGVRGFLTRKRFPELKEQLIAEKRMYAATLIQSIWKGYCVRKKINCRRKTVLIPTKGALTLARRLNDVVDVLNKQKKNEYSYKELATVFWNLDVCTSLSKEICIKTAEGNIVDNIFRFLQYSNQSQPSIEAREPAIRVLINLLRYHETSWLIWTRVVSANMIKDLIKMMKTSCGKFGASKRLYCAISTWIWIAMQDPKKNLVIRTFPVAVVDFKYMKDVLNRRHKNPRVERKLMVLPSTCPTWYIGSKCQKCFESDVYAIAQICKMLNVRR